MPYLKVANAEHKCDFPKQSKSGLLKLPPQSGMCRRFLRQIRMWFLVSGTNFRSDLVFRSIHTLRSEEKRQARYYPPYIIHPFSKFSAINEAMMAFVWAFSYFKDPFYVAFQKRIHYNYFDYSNIIALIIDFILMVQVILFFFTGYFVYKTKSVELNHKKIIKKYLLTYFIFDFLGAVPINTVYKMFIGHLNKANVKRVFILSIFRLFRLVRYKSFLTYLRRVTYWFKLSDSYYLTVCIVLTGILLIHWGVCILVTISTYFLYSYGQYNADSWIMILNEEKADGIHNYLVAVNIYVKHFLGAGPTTIKILNQYERFWLTFSILIGYLYISVALIITFISNKGHGAAENKYEEFLQQLNQFAKRKNLSPNLKTRMKIYTEHKFQKRYFDENHTLDTISLHLRYEVVLHRCRHLFQSVKLFRGLPMKILGYLVASLASEIFLENDVVLHGHTTETNCMYFIAYGTLAVYVSNGSEICHFEDGDFFGEVRLLYPERSTGFQFVAVDTSEIFILKREDFMHCLRNYSEFRTRVESSIEKKMEFLEFKEKQIKEAKIKSEDIIYELRHGRILEPNKRRTKSSVRHYSRANET